ncbi:MAG: hypothetical protein AAB375_00905 [Patescibacteria group bacterium]
MAKKRKVEAQCSSCGGTGVYQGFAEPKGVGVVCLNCDGSGKEFIMYRPFITRKRRRYIKTVRLSQGNFIATGAGPSGGSVTYEQFLAGKMPKR